MAKRGRPRKAETIDLGARVPVVKWDGSPFEATIDDPPVEEAEVIEAAAPEPEPVIEPVIETVPTDWSGRWAYWSKRAADGDKNAVYQLALMRGDGSASEIKARMEGQR